MSNYVKATNFTAKDSLPTGNAGKIVKGAEIDTELTAVASAISSKADLNSPALTGTPTAPTATYGTNTTQVATTAFVQAAIPSGVILLWSGSVATIPSGWALCNGSNGTPDLRNRFVVGAGSTYSVGDTGGSATSTLTTNELPAHTHSLSASGTTSGQSAGHTHTFSGTTGGMSANESHSHTATDSGHDHIYPTQNQGQTDSHFNDVCASSSFSGTKNGTPTSDTGYAQVTISSTSVAHTHTYSGTTSAVSGDHTHTVTVTGTSGSAGSGAAFTNLPPYYALAYIMRL
jgi:microcystin-dependent protein